MKNSVLIEQCDNGYLVRLDCRSFNQKELVFNKLADALIAAAEHVVRRDIDGNPEIENKTIFKIEEPND